MCSILTSIQAVADPEKDRVVILLANLVDNRFEALAVKIDNLTDKITDISDFIHDHSQCPVLEAGNEDKVKLLLMLAKYPKLVVAAIIGIFASLGATISGANLDAIKNFVIK